MPSARRIAVAILVPALAAATGCFAIFPLDEYNAGYIPADGGPTDASDSGPPNDVGPRPDVITNPKPNLDGGHVLFVTKETFTPDFQGIDGANKLCADAAQAAGLSGTFVAFLGVVGNPVLRFGKDGKNDTLPIIDTTARTIATSYAVLLQKGPSIQVDHDERGAQINFTLDGGVPDCEVNPAVAWTGSDGEGTAVNQSCSEWQVNAEGQQGQVGLGFAKDRWLSACVISCALKAHLYCAQR